MQVDVFDLSRTGKWSNSKINEDMHSWSFNCVYRKMTDVWLNCLWYITILGTIFRCWLIFTNHIYLKYINKLDLASNKLQWLRSRKTNSDETRIIRGIWKTVLHQTARYTLLILKICFQNSWFLLWLEHYQLDLLEKIEPSQIRCRFHYMSEWWKG